MNNKILITGGSGLLGQELLKLDPGLIAPAHSELDITDMASVAAALTRYQPSIVLHLAAATNPPEHDSNPEVGLRVNVAGTANMATACLARKIRLVFTSSDYVYAGPGPHVEDEPVKPVRNFYISKLAGECTVRLCPDSLVLRLSFGPNPFPWERVYDNQINSKLYVDEIAPLVLAAAKSTATGIINIGGPRTTLLEYAKRTRPNMQTIQTPDWVPQDTSLNIDRMKRELGIEDEMSLIKHTSSQIV